MLMKQELGWILNDVMDIWFLSTYLIKLFSKNKLNLWYIFLKIKYDLKWMYVLIYIIYFNSNLQYYFMFYSSFSLEKT